MKIELESAQVSFLIDGFSLSRCVIELAMSELSRAIIAHVGGSVASSIRSVDRQSSRESFTWDKIVGSIESLFGEVRTQMLP